MLNDKTTWKHIVKKLLYVILGCLNSSLEPTRGVRLATTSQGNIVSRSYEDLEDCVYHLTATNAPSAIYFNDEDKTCQLSNGCSNDCFLETTNNDNDKVVIQHCHGYSVGTLTTTTSNQTSTTRTMTAAPKLTSSIRTTKAISTQIFFTEKPKLFIIPCKCYIFKEWASLTEHEIIKLLIKNLTIDTSILHWHSVSGYLVQIPGHRQPLLAELLVQYALPYWVWLYFQTVHDYVDTFEHLRKTKSFQKGVSLTTNMT